MKSDFRYLPLFFLCWAILFSPFAILTAFYDQQKESKTAIALSCSEAARHTPCKGMIFEVYDFRCSSGINGCAIDLSSLLFYEEPKPVNLYWLNYKTEVYGDR